MDDRIPLDRTVLAQEVEAARATRSTQSTADEADKATYTPGYILRHPVDTVLLFVRSAVETATITSARLWRQPELLHR